MLIYLDSSLENVDWSSDNKLISVIDKLVLAMREGKHFLLGKRKTLDAILKTEKIFSCTTYVGISKVLENYATVGDFINNINTYIIVFYQNQDENLDKRGQGAFSISIESLFDITIDSTHILGENTPDTNIYIQAAKYYKNINKMPGELNLIERRGYGGTMPKEFGHILNDENKWCICIGDSDKKFPSACKSESTKKCDSTLHESKKIGSYYCLDCRELENFLPFGILKKIYEGNENVFGFDCYEKKVNINNDIHKYADLEKGHTRRVINSFKQGDNEKNFWVSIIKCLKKDGTINICDEIDNSCQKSCCCNILVPKFGGKVAEKAIDYLNKLKSDEFKYDLKRLIESDFNYSEWLEVGRLVYEWGCAAEITRS